MTSRGRGYGASDWDAREDYNSNHELSQYGDEEIVSFDHTRLYITNLPTGLSHQGLKEVFSKYGTLEECYVSKDPKKRYALFKYGTPGEAWVAMAKLNKTEPLFLNINIAKKSKAINQDRQNGYNERNNERPRRDREDAASIGSRSRRSRAPDEQTNGDSVKEKIEDELGLDRNLHMELESLKLEQLEIKKEQLKIKEEELVCKHRLLLLQSDRKGGASTAQTSGSNRCILPDGRIVVRAAEKFQDNDASFTAGAGDSLNIPALQRYGGRECIACGARADLYCAGCAITPYCSETCQKRDWGDRHRGVCHNLARLEKIESKSRSEPVVPEPEPVVPLTAPLRRPNNFKRDPPPLNEDRPRGKFIPPGEKAQAYQTMSNNKPSPVRNTRSFNNNNQEVRRTQNSDSLLGDETWDSKVQAAQQASPMPKPAQPERTANPVPVKDLPTPSQSQIPPKPADLMSLVKPKQKIEKPTVVERPTEVPAVKMEPANYLVEKLPIGESFLASVESPANECGTKQAWFVCLTMHGDFEQIYNKLCEDYTVHCERETGKITPSPGLLVSYLSPADGGWYRGRCLTSSRAALLDAAKTTDITPQDCKPMLDQYREYPEFSAIIQANGIKTGTNLQCTIKSKTANGFKVSIVDAEAGTDLGEGEVSRWVPEVEIPTPVPAVGPSSSTTLPSNPAIPSVPRPALTSGSRVVLLDAATLRSAALRPHNAERQFNAVLQGVLACVADATPLTESPVPGQVVIARYTDGLTYRALVKRVKAGVKFLVEYIEYGNEEVITSLDRLYLCPAKFDLTNAPAIASLVSLSDIETPALTKPALEYIEHIKDIEELILTIPSNEKTVPSGSLVKLTVAKNNESVNKKLEEMCTPDWKKLEARGGNVLETKALMYADLKNVELPVDREFILQISDFGSLKGGVVSGFLKGDPLADLIYGPLTDKMNKYCESELCREPYLPRIEELCITKCPPYPQWFRAVLVSLSEGAGSQEASVLYLDYGNLGTVPVADLRKMLPDFVDGYPALANTIEIANFPENPTNAQLQLAIEMININEEGNGFIKVNDIIRVDHGGYTVKLPSFISALKSVE